LGHFFHAVGVFFHHLAAVHWSMLGIALACHFARLLCRSYAWRAIVLSAYPEGRRLKLRSAFGAYVAGVGINSVVPARGGDVVKLYLVKQRLDDASYATLTPTLIVETMLDAVVAGSLIVWAMAIGALPAHTVYSRMPDVDWKWFLLHEKITLILLGVLALIGLGLMVYGRRRWGEFRARVARGFAILHERGRLFWHVLVPQAISWGFRLGTVYFFLKAFDVPATVHNALLVMVVDSLSTLFPATPGGAGTKQGLTEFLFRGRGVPATLLLAFSVGMNIALTVFNLVCGLIAIGFMAKTLSFKRLRSASRADQQVA
jgi:glycosyltransferase 2 family protein